MRVARLPNRGGFWGLEDDFDPANFIIPKEELEAWICPSEMARSGPSDGPIGATRTLSYISLMSLINREGGADPFVLLPMGLVATPPPVRLLCVLAFVARYRGPDVPISKQLLAAADMPYPVQRKGISRGTCPAAGLGDPRRPRTGASRSLASISMPKWLHPWPAPDEGSAATEEGADVRHPAKSRSSRATTSRSSSTG